MYGLGNIIKNGLYLRSALNLSASKPAVIQQKVLTNLIKQAKDTAFGKTFGFDNLLTKENILTAFSQNVPLHDYHKINHEWWDRAKNGEKNVCWPGKTTFYATVPQVSGAPFEVPVSEEMIQNFIKSRKEQLYSLSNFDIPTKVFQKDVLMLGSAFYLEKRNIYSELKTIKIINNPFHSYTFEKEVNWEDRLKNLKGNAENWKVGIITGIPQWILLILEQILSYHKLKNIHQLWPDLEVIVMPKYNSLPYRKKIEQLTGRPVIFVDNFFSPEGLIAYQKRQYSRYMSLNLDGGIYYEFIPVTDRNFTQEGNLAINPEVLNITEIKENEEYALVLSTCSGLWRYIMGEKIKICSLKNLEICFSGKLKNEVKRASDSWMEDHTKKSIELLDEFNNITPQYNYATA